MSFLRWDSLAWSLPSRLRALASKPQGGVLLSQPPQLWDYKQGTYNPAILSFLTWDLGLELSSSCHACTTSISQTELSSQPHVTLLAEFHLALWTPLVQQMDVFVDTLILWILTHSLYNYSYSGTPATREILSWVSFAFPCWQGRCRNILTGKLLSNMEASCRRGAGTEMLRVSCSKSLPGCESWSHHTTSCFPVLIHKVVARRKTTVWIPKFLLALAFCCYENYHLGKKELTISASQCHLKDMASKLEMMWPLQPEGRQGLVTFKWVGTAHALCGNAEGLGGYWEPEAGLLTSFITVSKYQTKSNLHEKVL